MELFYRFSVVVAIVGTLILSSCTDDVYDPERGIQTEPKENPLGEDFTAPDGFNWSMVNTVNLNVEINDEFDGRHFYHENQPNLTFKLLSLFVNINQSITSSNSAVFCSPVSIYP